MLHNALDGLTVVDFTQIGAGPTCTMLLADMGARVIKVESPAGELGRGLGPGWIGEDSALFHGFSRNMLGVSLNLRSADADVVVESMRPDVMGRLGLGCASSACQEQPGAPIRVSPIFRQCQCRRRGRRRSSITSSSTSGDSNRDFRPGIRPVRTA
jgi:hypothetical protein